MDRMENGKVIKMTAEEIAEFEASRTLAEDSAEKIEADALAKVIAADPELSARLAEIAG